MATTSRVSREQLDRARETFKRTGSLRAAARAGGISTDTVARHRKSENWTSPSSAPPPRGDEAPASESSSTGSTRSGARSTGSDPRPGQRTPPGRGKRGAPSDEQLEAMVRKIAKAPAIPASLWLRCEFCAAHFRTTAPVLARELVAEAHDDPDLREILEWLHRSWRRYAWAGLLVSWAGIPIMHHAAPEFVYRSVAPLAGLPPRESARHRHPPVSGAPPQQEPEPEPPTAAPGAAMSSPFAGMDTSQLLEMARQMGFELPEGMDLEALVRDAGLMGDTSADATAAASPENGTEPATRAERTVTEAEAAAEYEAAAAAAAAEAAAVAEAASADQDTEQSGS